ncbi:MAG: hypothetical protein SF051_01245 [Elusimicrobiota bacterium]|nr:hypothetical protein [Elusimicrobiota bacterium]
MRYALLLLLAAVPASADPALTAARAALSGLTTRHLAAAKAPQRRVFPLALTPVAPASSAMLLDAPLAPLRDRPLDAMTATVAGRDWTLGVVTDAAYDAFYLVARSGGDLFVEALAPLGRFLEDGGVVVSDGDGPGLRLNARINILNPLNWTSIVAVDADGGRRIGRDSFTVGEFVDAFKATGRRFTVGAEEFHLFVMPTAAAGGAGLNPERSFFLVRVAGTRTRAWAARETALEPGRAYRVVVANRALFLLKTADDRLVIRDGGPVAR